MAVTIQSLVAEAKLNKLSLIGPLTEDDVLLVWEKVAQLVETLMLQQKVICAWLCDGTVNLTCVRLHEDT